MKPCVVLGVTGGIAAYKAADIVSRLGKAGVDVYVIMTEHACQFITPLTLETLSHHPVVTDMFRRDTPWEVEHIALAQRADVFVVAPATANILGKMAHGIADDMLSTTLMATRAPILLAPAMNTNMYTHPAMQDNLRLLAERGCRFVGPDEGLLACGDVGAGRMSQPEAIVAAILDLLHPKRDLAGKRVLVTAGPTREPIDPVRYISNRSSGKMGYALARAALERGAEVTLVSGPVSLTPPSGAACVKVETTEQMLEAVLAVYDDMDIVIKAAAPADYRPRDVAAHKIKKQDGAGLTLEMTENPDIAKALGQRKRGQVLVAFAAETDHLLEHAREKLQKKGADLLVANDVTQPGSGFDVETNEVVLITAGEDPRPLPQMSKYEVAQHILDEAVRLMDSRAKA